MNDEAKTDRPDKIQWHAGFCSAMQLELMAQWPVLHFEREFSLTKKPLAVDLLIIRKDTDSVIESDVGRFFRRHNLLEYKSPEDEMGVDTYYKALACACLYKTDAPTEDGIPAEDITLSLVREAYPRKNWGLPSWMSPSAQTRHSSAQKSIRRRIPL